jgi:hypothetical protein
LCYLYGYFFILKPQINKKRLIIADRYTYDIYLDPKRFRLNLPKWILRAFVKMLPQPDITVALTASPETIISRKPELSVDEIKQYQTTLVKSSIVKHLVVQNADKTIFRNANYIVTPTDKNTEEGIRACEELGKILGFKTVCQLSPEKHDEMIGFLSQLTHCIAVSLMTCKDSTELVNYTGDSFRDLTRIAKINETMWTELFLLNKDELLSQMDLFSNKFEELKNAIKEENTEKMKEIMITSTTRRAYFDKK